MVINLSIVNKFELSKKSTITKFDCSTFIHTFIYAQSEIKTSFRNVYGKTIFYVLHTTSTYDA